MKSSLLKLGFDIKLGHCYEVLAKINGYKDWASFVGAIKKSGASLKTDSIE
jgi:hypothetical protein